MLLRAVSLALPVALGGLAFLTLRRELAGLRLSELRSALDAVPEGRIALAVLAVAGGYVALTLHDLLGVRYTGSRLPYARLALPAFVGFAFANNVGAAVLSGGTVRFRLYGPLGLGPGDIARVTAFANLTIVLGEIVLGALSLLLAPEETAGLLRLPPPLALPAGASLLAVSLLYLVGTRAFPAGIRVLRFHLPSPRLPLAVGQIAVSCADWSLAALTFWLLIPADLAPGYPAVLAVFVGAQLLGGLSQVPGGLGVFDSLVLAALAPALGSAQVITVLLLYRFLYYVVPFVLAVGMLAGFELARRRRELGRLATAARGVFGPVVPGLAALAAFLAGTALLVLGALPAYPGRLAMLSRALPGPLLDASHLVGSVVGVLLLLLGRGLLRRLDGAWLTAVTLLGAGAVLSLLRGLQVEPALLLALLAVALLPFRGEFHRHTSLVKEAFTIEWIAAVALVIGATVWLGWFAHRHEAWRGEVFWRVSVESDVPRFVRASVAVVATALLLGMTQLLRPAQHVPAAPPPGELARVTPLLRASPRARDRRFLDGDVPLLVSPAGDAVLPFASRGGVLLGLGDPVGAEPAATELCWRLRDLADRHHAIPAFLGVGAGHLSRYMDLGLTPARAGEAALIAVDGAAPAVEGLEIEERGDRLELRVGEIRVVAFASGAELAVERLDVAGGVGRAGRAGLERIAAALCRAAVERGCATVDLGLAPLADGATELPAWTGLGTRPYTLGALFTGPADLRRALEALHPVWETRYLAAPGSDLPTAARAAGA